MTTNNAKLMFKDQAIELFVYQPTLGKDVIDVSSLGKFGAFTFDPGFMATASCESKITFINGEKGILLYRGYPIEQLAEKSDYMEVCYLLLNGELPTKDQKNEFIKSINKHMQLDENIGSILTTFAKDAHPMAMMMAAVSALAAAYHGKFDLMSEKDRYEIAIMLIAKTPTLAAMCYRHGQGEAFLAPREDLDYAENFLHMMFGKKGDQSKPNPTIAKAMDVIFTLHADHEQNASTSTVRLSGSTGTDACAAIVAGISALWGPAHGGANEAALNMLHEIGHVDKIEDFIVKAKDKTSGVRLMGFGHRVYKNYDPRANVMRGICHDVLEAMGKHDDETFKVAMSLEKIALSDSYFIERKLYPNVDFYSGITQSALGIPANMFTVVFVLGRMVGWISHFNEMLSGPYKIGRPRQLYTGYTSRDYVKKG